MWCSCKELKMCPNCLWVTLGACIQVKAIWSSERVLRWWFLGWVVTICPGGLKVWRSCVKTCWWRWYLCITIRLQILMSCILEVVTFTEVKLDKLGPRLRLFHQWSWGEGSLGQLMNFEEVCQHTGGTLGFCLQRICELFWGRGASWSLVLLQRTRASYLCKWSHFIYAH